MDKGTKKALVTESHFAFRLKHGDSLAAEKSVRVGLPNYLYIMLFLYCFCCYATLYRE